MIVFKTQMPDGVMYEVPQGIKQISETGFVMFGKENDKGMGDYLKAHLPYVDNLDIEYVWVSKDYNPPKNYRKK